eukprot:14861646-Alexandrium_andersonii.AAC.1
MSRRTARDQNGRSGPACSRPCRLSCPARSPSATCGRSRATSPSMRSCERCAPRPRSAGRPPAAERRP